MENKINIKCEKYTSFFSLGLDVRLLKISKKVLALMEKLCSTLLEKKGPNPPATFAWG